MEGPERRLVSVVAAADRPMAAESASHGVSAAAAAGIDKKDGAVSATGAHHKILGNVTDALFNECIAVQKADSAIERAMTFMVYGDGTTVGIFDREGYIFGVTHWIDTVGYVGYVMKKENNVGGGRATVALFADLSGTRDALHRLLAAMRPLPDQSSIRITHETEQLLIAVERYDAVLTEGERDLFLDLVERIQIAAGESESNAEYALTRIRDEESSVAAEATARRPATAQHVPRVHLYEHPTQRLGTAEEIKKAQDRVNKIASHKATKVGAIDFSGECTKDHDPLIADGLSRKAEPAEPGHVCNDGCRNLGHGMIDHEPAEPGHVCNDGCRNLGHGVIDHFHRRK
jgi:hypothetical protein